MMSKSCPTNRKAWEILVAKHKGDEVAARKEYKNNNYEFTNEILAEADAALQIPEVENLRSEENELITRQIKNLSEMGSVISKKLSRLKRIGFDESEKGMKKLQELVNLASEYDFLSSARNNEILYEYISAMQRMANSTISIFEKHRNGEGNYTISQLQKVKTYMDSLKIANNIDESFFEHDPVMLEEFIKMRDFINNTVAKANKIYIEAFRDELANSMADTYGKVLAKYKEDYEREYNANHLASDKEKYSGKELKDKKAEYIREAIALNAEKIEKETRDYIRGMLGRNVDIGTVTEWVVNPKDMNHDIMNIAVQYLDKQDYFRQRTNSIRTRKANDLHSKYIKARGNTSDMKKLYEPVLFKVDGKTSDMVVVRPDLLDPNLKDSERELYIKQYNEFKAKYEGTVVMEMQEFLEDLIETKENNTPERAKLYNKLPNINKGFFERASAVSGGKSVLSLLKEEWFDITKLRASDTEFGDVEDAEVNKKYNSNRKEVLVDENGMEVSIIPIHYRRGDISESDKSSDALTMLLLDADNIDRYNDKVEAGIFMNGLKDSTKEMDIIQTTGMGKLKYDKDTKQLITKKGVESNIIRAIDEIYRHRVLGIQVEGDPKLVKTLAQLKVYTSALSLAFNQYSSATNYMQGHLMNWIEGTGSRSGFFNKSNLIKAAAKYQNPGDAVTRIGDLARVTPLSKTNRLKEMFNPGSELQMMHGISFAENNALKRHLNGGLLHQMQQLGDAAVTGNIMYAILDNIKVLDGDGNFLDKNFKPTKNREEAISLDEAYSINEETNELELHPSISSTERTEGVTDSDMQKISAIMRTVTRDLYGNYDSNNKSKIQRMAVLSMATQMRGWLVPGVQRRWRGISMVGIDKNEMLLQQRAYNQDSEQFKEGIYTTTIRFFKQMSKEWKSINMQTVPENWNKLTDYEKDNVTKTAYEVGLIVAFWLLSTALKGMSDDEPKDSKMDLYAVYLSRRIYSELATFANPLEAVRTFRNPMMAINTVNNGLELILQMFGDAQSLITTGDAERYKYGDKDYKIKKKVSKMIPIFSAQTTDIKDKINYIYN